VCVVSADNDDVGDRLTLDELAAMPMVLTHWQGSASDVPAARQLSMRGVQPNVVLVAESFLALPFLVSGTDRVGLVHERLARRVAAAADGRVLPCPFDAAPVVEALWWQPMHDRDPGHRWLRAVFADVAGHLPAI